MAYGDNYTNTKKKKLPTSSADVPPATSVKPTKNVEQEIYTSPPGQNDTIIYNSSTGKYKVQSRTPGTSNIVEKDLLGNILYQGTSDADTRATVEQAKINDAKVAKANAPIKPDLSPEQQAQIGQINTNTGLNPNDAITQDIQKNINMRFIELGLNPDGTPLTIDPNAPLGEALKTSTLRNFGGLPRLNQLTGFISSVPFGGAVVNSLTSNKDVRDYLKDYSNADNLASIRENIAKSDTKITEMISNAKLTENTPENNKYTIMAYNAAMQRKYDSIAQLKKIADNDPRAYTETIRDDLIELELYFNGDPSRGVPAGKLADDYALYAALNKPSPKYLQNTQGDSN